MSDDLHTDDDIARLFADANPIPNHAAAPGGWSSPTRNGDHAAADELVIGLEEPTEPVVRQDHRRRWGLVAAAVIALIVGLTVTTWAGDDDASVDDRDSIPTRITTPDTLTPNRLSVVDAFMAALSAHDAAAMGRTLAPGVVPALVPGAEGSPAGTASLDDQLAWLAAMGATSTVENCREHGESGVYCTCAFGTASPIWSRSRCRPRCCSSSRTVSSRSYG